MRRLRIALIAILVIGVLVASGFVIWANTPPAPMAEALAALESDTAVTVDQSRWIVFTPSDVEPTTGFIFYPGGRVDARSYAPALKAIAQQGYLAVIVPMPLNLAIFGIDGADDVIAAYPAIQHWVIGGHSLGGSMAGRYAHNHPATIDGIVLWASYVEDSFSLANTPLAAASISGTEDGLATETEIENSRATLPADTTFVVIEGGNHAQFGYYGDQQGDNPATISRTAQQEQVIAATLIVLEEFNDR